MRRIINPYPLILLIFLLIPLNACGAGTIPASNASTQSGAGSKAQQMYRIGLVPGDIASFDPAIATDANSVRAVQMVFTGLVSLDDRLNVQPQLASSYQVSSDGLIYTFTLRQHLTFSDGVALTTDDVAYSLDRALSPEIAAQNGTTSTYLGLLKDASQRLSGQRSTLIGDSINVLNASTIALIVSKKNAFFLTALASSIAYVIEQYLVQQYGQDWTNHLSDNHGAGGAGPFKVTSYSHSSGIVLLPNTDYYGKKPQLQRVELDFFPSLTASYTAYQSGQIDTSGIPSEDAIEASELGKQYHSYKTLVVDYLAMNFLAKPFDNIHIRQAFALTIDRDALAKSTGSGLNTPTCHLVPSGLNTYNSRLRCPGNAPTSGNSTLAQALFQQGLQEEKLTQTTFPQITLTYQSNAPVLDTEMASLRQMWQQILGITVNFQILDAAQLLQAIANTTCSRPDLNACQNQGLQLWYDTFSEDYPDAQDWLSNHFVAGSPANTVNYGQNLSSDITAQQTAQQQLVQADAGVNRLTNYNLVEQALVNDIAWLPLDQRTTTYVSKPYLLGVNDNPISQTPPDDWAKVYIIAH